MQGKIRILLVEDEAISALLLKRSLEREGHEVYEPLATGKKALEFAENHQIDVILLDINLAGDMDGIETAKKITATRDIPIIFTTGYMDNAIEERASVLQPIAYIVKPIIPDSINDLISKQFGNRNSITEEHTKH